MNSQSNPVDSTAQEHEASSIAQPAYAVNPETDDSVFNGLFFPGGGRRKVVESLEHFARYGSMLLFLKAGPGAGKTTVLRQFILSTDSDTQKVFLQGKRCPALLASLEAELGLAVEVAETDTPSAASDDEQAEFQPELAIEDVVPEGEIGRLRNYCRDLASRGRSLLVVIDDVDRRHHEDLDELIGLADAGASNLKLVLSGSATACKQVNALADARGVLLNSVELTTFSSTEAVAYAQFYLAANGVSDEESPYSELQLNTAWTRSEGNINRFHQLLAEFPVSPKGQSPRPVLPLPHLLVAILLVGVIGTLVWLRGSEQESVGDVAPIVLERIDIGQEAESSNENAQAKVAEPTEPAANGLANEDTAQDEEAAELAQVDIEPEKTAKAVLAASGNLEAPGTTEVADNQREPEAGSKAVKEPVDEPKSTVDSTQPPNELSGVVKNAGQAEKPVGIAPARDKAVRDRLLAWPDTGYALQLFGTHNESRAQKLVEDYFGRADLLFYETRHDGKPWFVVINGPYSGSESARRGIDELPDGLRGLRPWPRNVASIKRDIKRLYR